MPHPRVPPAFGHWLAGFVDGEGSFLINRRVARGRWESYVPTFSLILRSDDRELLLGIVRRTDIGTVSRTRAATGTGGRPTVRWSVEARADLEALARLLDDHPLRSRKARDYAVWRQAVAEYAGIRRSGGRGTWKRSNADVWERIARLRVELLAGREFREG